MSASLRWSDQSLVLVEETPLPGIVSLDMECEAYGATKVAAIVRGDHQTAVKSVELLAQKMGYSIEVVGLEVKP